MLASKIYQFKELMKSFFSWW